MLTRPIQITLKDGSAAERRMQQQLELLLQAHDLDGFIFTDRVEIVEDGMPHSHPVLTLNTAYADDPLMALSEFVHEQLHWFEEERADDRERAIAETKRLYPVVPVTRPEGAGDEYSTRLHLVVCYLEFQAMAALVGTAEARRAIEALSRHHYCWVYRTVLQDDERIGNLVRDHGLLPDPLLRRSPS